MEDPFRSSAGGIPSIREYGRRRNATACCHPDNSALDQLARGH